MKSILCFGDSNTWGYRPGIGARFSRDLRWTGVMQAQLGDRYHVIEEGLCGRTAAHDDPERPGRNGRTLFPLALETHAPLDLVIIMLGTNELKTLFKLEAGDIASEIAALADMVPSLEPPVPQVLLIAPAHCIPELYASSDLFAGAVEKSQQLAPYLEKEAISRGYHFFDAAPVAAADPADGIHLGITGHAALAGALAGRIRKILA